MATEKQPIVIKKYANRRLYHTGTSSYVTLGDLAGLVRGGDDFVVYDAKSGDEITRSVLAQIIFEEENKEGQNLLPVTVLRQLIRFYGDSMQAVVPRYLEFSMDNLLKEQSHMREQIAKSLGMKTMEAMEKQTQANMKLFTDAFRLFTPFIPAAGEAGAALPEADAPDGTKQDGTRQEGVKAESRLGTRDDLHGLREELSAMRERLDKLSGKS